MLEVDLAGDIYPIDELPDSVRRVVDKVVEAAHPLIVTREGHPVAAVVEISELERLRRLAELADEYREIITAHDGPWLQHDAVWDELREELERARTSHGADGGSKQAHTRCSTGSRPPSAWFASSPFGTDGSGHFRRRRSRR